MAFQNSPAQDYVFSNHSSLLKANASSQEQKFLENLVVERSQYFLLQGFRETFVLEMMHSLLTDYYGC